MNRFFANNSTFFFLFNGSDVCVLCVFCVGIHSKYRTCRVSRVAGNMPYHIVADVVACNARRDMTMTTAGGPEAHESACFLYVRQGAAVRG